MHSLRFVTSLLINAGPSPSSSSSSSSSSYRVVVAAGRNNNSNSSSNIDRSSSHITLAEAIKASTTPGYVVESIDKRLLISRKYLEGSAPAYTGFSRSAIRGPPCSSRIAGHNHLILSLELMWDFVWMFPLG